ncbi:MAG: radical SAM protein [Oscillospiraceae bacterium]|nr:radical SAM protein [Oscillospiraceae bacterium]
MKKKYIIPVFIPHYGCKNECVFCDQRKISGQTKNIKPADIRKTIEYYLKIFQDERVEKEIAFFGGSFTGIDQTKQEEFLKIANEYIENGKASSVRISTRPDYIDKDILKFLKKYKVKTIELGVQSGNDIVLEKAKRGHDFNSVVKASKLIRRHGFVLGHQMMVGLPDSTKQDEINTAIALTKLKPKIVRIYPVLVLKGTELEKMYETGEYEPLTVEQAVDRVKELYYIFDKRKIKVIRIGLQNTENITNPQNEKSTVIAGPYHPAFGQLVESAMWYDALVSQVKPENVRSKEIEVRVHPENVNNIIGHKKENIKRIKELYDVDIKVIEDFEMKKERLKSKVLSNYSDFLDE